MHVWENLTLELWVKSIDWIFSILSDVISKRYKFMDGTRDREFVVIYQNDSVR